MGLLLINLQSNQEINLDKDIPFVIGRGLITGCTDKRVSRSHGKITCTNDGKVSVLALHANPCFFTRKGAPPVLQLNKNEEQILNEGDCLGLLPNSFWYQISSTSRLQSKKSDNSDLKSPERKVPKTETISQEELTNLLESNNSQTPKCPISDNNINNTPLKNVVHEVPAPSCSGENTNVVIPENLKGTCKLPLWKYEIKGQKSLAKMFSKSTSKTVSDESKNKHFLGAQSTLQETTAAVASSSTVAPVDKTNIPAETKSCKDDLNNVANAFKSKLGRPYCQYDADCYRKNVQHKLEYSHPGDEDYLKYENRPLCLYGASCYRKNLLHRRQFRHVTFQAPQIPQDLQTSQTPDAPVPTVNSAEAPKAPNASVDSTPAPVDPENAPSTATPTTSADSMPEAPSTSSSKGKRKDSGKKRKTKKKSKDKTKRKRLSEKDRSPRSCRLSVTVSSHPKQKPGRNSQIGTTSYTSFYSSDVNLDDLCTSSDPFSDAYSSDDYLPSTDDSDDFDDLEYYGKDYFRDYFF